MICWRSRLFLQSSPLHHHLFRAHVQERAPPPAILPGRIWLFLRPAPRLSRFSLLLGISLFAIALRISFISSFSTHSQSVCMRVGMSNARMAHTAAQPSSALTSGLFVLSLRICMFNLLSFREVDSCSSLSQSLPIAGQGKTRPSIPVICVHRGTLQVLLPPW